MSFDHDKFREALEREHDSIGRLERHHFARGNTRTSDLYTAQREAVKSILRALDEAAGESDAD